MTGSENPQDRIDALVQSYYGGQFREAERLTERSAGGRVEFARVQELLRDRLRPASRILDVGGGTGIHAAWLAGDGHDVTMIDPVPEQVDAAAAQGGYTALVGDARRLEFGDESFDAVLLFGPLYHLAARDDRLLALREAVRVLRPGGLLAAAGVSRLMAHADEALMGVPKPYPERLARLMTDGVWEPEGEGFPGAHFHDAAELTAEVGEAGVDATVVGLEGPAGFGIELVKPSDAVVEAALVIARAADASPYAPALSPHLLALGRKPERAGLNPE